MSDGHDNRADPIPVMRRIRQAHARSNLQVHTIAFGSGVPRLQELAVVGGGKYHECQTGVQLSSTFTSIAMECTAIDGLVSKFGEILSEVGR
jgi:hypothetical protein